MSDIDQGGGPISIPGGDDQGQPPAPGVRVLAQFIRDLSFENPNAPDSLAVGNAQPQMDLGVEMNARGRPDGLFEMDLKLTASASRDGTAVFHCELLYGGLFQIGAQNEMDTEVILMTECPRYLFPFARQIVAELSAQGGFPPFMIEPIDFAAIYLAQRAQANQQPIGQA